MIGYFCVQTGQCEKLWRNSWSAEGCPSIKDLSIAEEKKEKQQAEPSTGSCPVDKTIGWKAVCCCRHPPDIALVVHCSTETCTAEPLLEKV